MSGKVVCVANRKGGVGKTTVAVVLAQTVQDQFNQSAAVVDVDPQGSATFALAGPKLSSKLESRMLQNVLRSHDKFSSPMPLSRFAWGQVSALTRQPDIPLALVPCSEELWGLEDEIADSAFGKEAQMRTRFRRLLDRLRREFNVVIVDTPPGRSFFGREAAKAADIILVPCDVTTLAYGALRVFIRELRKMKKFESSYLVWTKNKNVQGVLDFEKGLEPDMLDRKLFDGTWDVNLQGIRLSPSFAKGVVQTQARSFESVYPRPSGDVARALAEAVLKRLNME